jgi:hypothetical protein
MPFVPYPEIAAGKGSAPDTTLPLNARSSWDRGVTTGPYAVTPTNPALGGPQGDYNAGSLGATPMIGEVG